MPTPAAVMRIRMTDAGRLDANEHVAGTQAACVERLVDERPAGRGRRTAAEFASRQGRRNHGPFTFKGIVAP